MTCDVVVRLSFRDLAAAAPAVQALLSRGTRVLVELGPPGDADLRVVDALARLGLAARRSPGALGTRSTDALLHRLTDLAGLTGALALDEVERQPQPHEQLLAEEVVDVGDPAG